MFIWLAYLKLNAHLTYSSVQKQLICFAPLKKVLILNFFSLHLLRVIKDVYTRNLANELVDNCLTGDFGLNLGVLQLSKLGPILFHIYIIDLLIKLQSVLGAKFGDIIISCLGFSDDIVLISESPESLHLEQKPDKLLYKHFKNTLKKAEKTSLHFS